MAQRYPRKASPTQENVAGPSSRNMKVAIPRLKRGPSMTGSYGEDRGGGSAFVDKQRVSHACEPCRRRKTKCNGEKPVCRHCIDFGISCSYGDGKREKARNELKYLQERTEAYEGLLKSLYQNQHVDAEGMGQILSHLKDSINWEQLRSNISSNQEKSPEVSAQQGSSSFRNVDKVAHDFGGAATDLPHGYLGQSSDMSWLGIIKDIPSSRNDDQSTPSSMADLKGKSRASGGSESQLALSLADNFQTSYHLDDLNPNIPLPNADEALLLPPRHIADRLVDVFFSTIHETFPILFRPQFMKEYEVCKNNGQLPHPPQTWLASLNVIFAIGAFYSHLTNAPWKSTQNDHLRFLAKAQVLFLHNGVLFHNPDQRQLQALGLLGIYLLATRQINRCWNVVGLAIRNAYSLGLHLSSDLTGLDRVQQELRHRKWYTLISLERICSIMTGRPAYIDEKRYNIPELSGINEDGLQEVLEEVKRRSEICGTPYLTVNEAMEISEERLPLQFPELEEKDGYFSESSKLHKISLEILNTMYSAGTVKLSWRDVQLIIVALSDKLTLWSASLPEEFKYETVVLHETNVRLKRKKLLLHVDYLNTVILLYWPCLCTIKRAEADESFHTDHEASIACVNAARKIISTLPDDISDAQQFWETCPWWIILYYIVSSGMVVMMEMMLHAEHMPEQKDLLLDDSLKIHRWLTYMGQYDLAAQRSLEMLNKMMVIASSNIGHRFDPSTGTVSTLNDLELTSLPEIASSEITDILMSTLSQGPSGQVIMPQFSESPLDNPVVPLDYTLPFQEQVALGIPGLVILARTGFYNVGLLYSQYVPSPELPAPDDASGEAVTPNTQTWPGQQYAGHIDHSATHIPQQQFQSNFPMNILNPTYDTEYSMFDPDLLFEGSGAPEVHQDQQLLYRWPSDSDDE